MNNNFYYTDSRVVAPKFFSTNYFTISPFYAENILKQSTPVEVNLELLNQAIPPTCQCERRVFKIGSRDSWHILYGAEQMFGTVLDEDSDAYLIHGYLLLPSCSQCDDSPQSFVIVGGDRFVAELLGEDW